MSTNLEPIVNKIVTNTTVKDVLNNVDLNLIDPYKIADMEDSKEINLDNKEKNSNNKKDFDDKIKNQNIFQEKFDINKVPESNIYEDYDYDIDNLNSINEDKKFVNNFTEEIKKQKLNITESKIKKDKENLKGKYFITNLFNIYFIFYFYLNRKKKYHKENQ
jgi:hypothetical protein